MATLSKRAPRGAAALEFALVAPLLLLLLMGVVYFGLALSARFQLSGLAESTARACVAMQNTGDSQATLSSCVPLKFAEILTQYSGTTGCAGTPVATALPIFTLAPLTTGNFGGSTQRLVLLQVQVSCNFNVNPLNVFSGGQVSGTLPLQATAAMPFVLGTNR